MAAPDRVEVPPWPAVGNPVARHSCVCSLPRSRGRGTGVGGGGLGRILRGPKHHGRWTLVVRLTQGTGVGPAETARALPESRPAGSPGWTPLKAIPSLRGRSPTGAQGRLLGGAWDRSLERRIGSSSPPRRATVGHPAGRSWKATVSGTGAGRWALALHPAKLGSPNHVVLGIPGRNRSTEPVQEPPSGPAQRPGELPALLP